MSDAAYATHTAAARRAGLLLMIVVLCLLGLSACRAEETAQFAGHPSPAAVIQEQPRIEPIGFQSRRAAQPQTLQTTVIRWAAWVTLLTAIGLTLIWIARRNGRRRWFGALLLGLFLIIGRFWLWPGP